MIIIRRAFGISRVYKLNVTVLYDIYQQLNGVSGGGSFSDGGESVASLDSIHMSESKPVSKST